MHLSGLKKYELSVEVMGMVVTCSVAMASKPCSAVGTDPPFRENAKDTLRNTLGIDVSDGETGYDESMVWSYEQQAILRKWCTPKTDVRGQEEI